MLNKIIKQTMSLALAAALLLGFPASNTASAKTSESAKGENIFFYALNAEGKSVLLKVVPLSELKKISHGQLDGILTGKDTGVNYRISTTDNYPTTQYCEARGVTVPELVDYVKSVTSVGGAESVTFAGEDVLRLMATDSFGTYNRSWSYDELYGTERYYFEDLYSKDIGWKIGWEVAGENSPSISLDVYNAEYKDRDRYYADKRAVFETGVRTIPILATESYSGRTTTEELVSSTEPGIAKYVEDNYGVVAGCLSDALEDTWSLRLAMPMSEADLMSARRTAFDNFKWIYNMRLDMSAAPRLASQGTVAEPQASITQGADGKTLTLAITCPTPGAMLYYSFDGSPQTPYTGPVKIDIAGRDLAAEPVSFYMTAVKEGWDDAGIVTARYPGLPPAFDTQHSGMVGATLVFHAASVVGAAEWNAWTGAIGGIALKTPDVNGYLTLDKSKYNINNNEKTITFDKGLFTVPGSYSFIFRAAMYSNKSVSISMKEAAPAVVALDSYDFGADIVLTFDDESYQTGLSVYITPPGGESALISPAHLDRSAPGRLTIKASYSDSPSCVIKEPGTYTLELRNPAYAPDGQTVRISIGDGSGFSDVAADAWYFDAVRFVTENGLFGGVGGGLFSPGGGMTRAMFVTVLSRHAGIDTGESTGSGFADVQDGEWYTAAVKWASANKIVEGVGAGRFAPDRQITREEMATILCRYAVFTGSDVNAGGTLAGFTDADKVSGWAREALVWAVTAGLMNGMPDGTLIPQVTTTRAQAAQVIMKFCLLGQ